MAPTPRTRPTFSNRMSDPLEAFTVPSDDPTWEGTHHKHTIWLSDEVWAELGRRSDAEAASKSKLAENALRALLGLPPEA